MGFFDQMMKAVEQAKKDADVQSARKRRWQEELDYYKNSKIMNTLIDVDTMMSMLTNISSSMKSDFVNHQIFHGNILEGKDASNIEINMQKQKEEARKILYEEKDDNMRTLLKETIVQRDERVALCMSYLSHPKATSQGKREAMTILLNSAFYCASKEDVRKEYFFRKNRFAIYRREQFYDSSCLDICFYTYLIDNCEKLCNIGESEDEYDKNFSTMIGAGNTRRDYSEICSSLKLYGLSSKYTDEIAQRDTEFFTAFCQFCVS